MKNGLFAFFALVALFAALGCPPPKHCDVTFSLNEPFSLHQGAIACSKDAGELTIRFDSVSGDSRCPIGVQCIWAGRADVVLTLTAGEKTQAATLSSGDLGQGGAGETTFEGYTVRLENVEPPAQESKRIEQKDYKVKMNVSK